MNREYRLGPIGEKNPGAAERGSVSPGFLRNDLQELS